MTRKYRHPTRLGPTQMSPLYSAFIGMHERVQPGYKFAHRYFDRGITIARCWAKGRWDTFADWALAHGFTPGLELDRRNNDRGYSPGNCRFVTHLENSRNRDAAHHAAATKAGIARRTGAKRAQWRARQSASATKRWARFRARKLA